MSYFKDTVVNILGNKKLRGPQREAYITALEYFSDNSMGEALIVLPTGTGKSGLISLLPYGISDGRVLVITPGIITKKSVIKSLHPLDENFWLNQDVIFDPKDLPVVEEYDADMLDDSLNKCDFVITNIHKLYAGKEKSLLSRVSPDFFDMIIVDEAHHSVASSWQDVLKYFDRAKKIHLTGTPYRGDKAEIPGHPIHTTSLATAMSLKLIKWLRKTTVNSENMYFTMPDDSHIYTKAEILEFKDQDWIKRNVALSKECSNLVIEETINRLHEIKKLSPNVPHKILAVACSISHAEDVASWYKEKGEIVVIVHSDMDKEKIEENLLRIENHECTVVVSVNMMVEGYDHKYLSVLGVFRPYKSLNAFAQIVGRVLRSIPENEITDYAIDNNAYVVYHQETGLDDMWTIFQKEVVKSKVIKTRDYIFTDREYQQRNRTFADIEIENPFTTEIISYLPDIDFNKKFEEAKDEIEKNISDKISKMDVSMLSEEEINAMKELFRDLQTKGAKNRLDKLLVEKRPETARQEIRTFLYETSNEAAQSLLLDKGIDPKGHELYHTFRKLIPIKPTITNDGILVFYMNSRLSRKYGVVGKRKPEQLLESKKYLETIVEELRRMI